MGRRIEGTVALVTGANRGIGKAFVEALLARGAARVYATARRPEALAGLAARHGDRVRALALDVTDPVAVAAAAEAAPDVRLLVNNAGVATVAPLLEHAALTALRVDLDVNVLALLDVTRAFAPALVRHGGVVVNLGSVASLVNFPLLPTYSVSKAATHSLTQALRAALAPQGVLVAGVYPGPVDTDMGQAVPFDKTPAPDVAHAVLDGVEAGDEEIFPDVMARGIGASYYADPRALERQVTGRDVAAVA